MRPPTWGRAALSHPCFTGIARQHLGEFIAELADPWTAQHQATLAHRRGHPRRRAAGAGPHQRLVLCDRVLATLIVLRLQLPHQALAVLLGVDRATITRAIGQIRPLLAARGLPPRPAHAAAADLGGCGRLRGGQRRGAAHRRHRDPGPPARAHRPGRRAFISGKRKQNTLKPTVISDGQGRTLWAGAVRPGRMHDQTAVKTKGIADLLTQHPGVKIWVDEGYQGLTSAFAEQVTAPPCKPAKDVPAELEAAYRQARTEQSSRRICVEHAIAEHKS
jgi:hypothetical protein